MRILGSVLAVFLLASPCVLGGCDSEKPKTEVKKAEPTPVPSDMVFNDFIPATGGPTGMRARDAGSEGGLGDVQGGPGDQDPTAGGPPGNGTKLVEAGADPKAVRKYVFTVGKVEKRVITTNTAVSQSMGGQTAPAQEITMKVSLDLKPTAAKKEGGATLELKVTKVEFPGAPPQVAPMLAAMIGMTGTVDVTPQGDVGEMQIQATPAMRNELAQTVVQALSQAVQLIVCPLPLEPIGAGAKWDVVGQGGQPDQGTKHFVAKELSADGATIDTDIEIKIPRRMQETPKGKVFLEVDGKGKYTYAVKWTGTASKVDGNMTINEKIEVPAGGGQPKQQVSQVQTVKHTVETAK